MMKDSKRHTVLPSDLDKDDALLVRMFYYLHGNYKKIAFAMNQFYKEAGMDADGTYFPISVLNSRLGRLRKLGIPLYTKRAGKRWIYPMKDARKKSERLGLFVLADDTTLDAIVERLVAIATDFLTKEAMHEDNGTEGILVSLYADPAPMSSGDNTDPHWDDTVNYLTKDGRNKTRTQLAPKSDGTHPSRHVAYTTKAEEHANLFTHIDKGSPRDVELLIRIKVANVQVSSTINMLAMQSLMLEEVIDILER